MSYKKFLIQQQSCNGVSYVNVGSVVDTYASFGVVCQTCPFRYLPAVKELPERNHSGEDGVGVFFPSGGHKFRAYDMEARFLYCGPAEAMHDNIVSFLDFIYGRNAGGSSLLAVYDEYTQIGRRGVYVLGVSSELYDYTDESLHGLSLLKVKFRVTDPVEDVVLSV